MFIVAKIQAEKTQKLVMLFIMNYDFAITSIITCFIEKGQNTNDDKGRVKEWRGFLTAFKSFYTNSTRITRSRSFTYINLT